MNANGSGTPTDLGPGSKPDWSPDNPGLLLIADIAKMLVDGLAKK